MKTKLILFLLILLFIPVVYSAGLQNANIGTMENAVIEENRKIETNIKAYIDLKSDTCVNTVQEKSDQYIEEKLSEIKTIFFIEKLLIFFSGFAGALGGNTFFKILNHKREKNNKQESGK